MAPIFSHRFFAQAGGLHTYYTVPASSTAVIRSITAYNGNTSSPAEWYLGLTAAGLILALALEPPSSTTLATPPHLYDTRIVINGGEQIELLTAQYVQVTVSGYLFAS
jgi:hypothetical protein